MTTFKQNILAGLLLLTAFAGFGLLSFSKQRMLNDVYATSVCVYNSSNNNGWDVTTGDDPTWVNLENGSNTMFAGCDSIAKQPVPAAENMQQEKKAADTNKNNIIINLLFDAFSWLYNSGVLRLPPL